MASDVVARDKVMNIQFINGGRSANSVRVCTVRCRSGAELWFALYKTTATAASPTYWLDDNPSTYRWWGGGDPNEDVQCIRITPTGFRDRPCNLNYRYICKMDAGIFQLGHSVDSITVVKQCVFVYALPFEPVMRSRSILGLGLPSLANGNCE